MRTKGTGESGADLLLLPSVLTLAEEARQKGECGMGEAAARVVRYLHARCIIMQSYKKYENTVTGT